MNIKCGESNIKLQVFKKVAKFYNIKNSINVFKKNTLFINFGTSNINPITIKYLSSKNLL